MPEPLRLFVIWNPNAEGDSALSNRLMVHLAILHPGIIVESSPYGAGATRIDRADIVLLLISPEFFNSEVSANDMHYALRQRARGLYVVPVLLHYVELGETQLAALRLRSLPHNGRPIAAWRNRDRAFTDVVKGVREVAEAIRHRQSPSTTAVEGSQTHVYVLSDKADRVMRNRFVRHLKPFEAKGRIRIWHADQLTPGDSLMTDRREFERANVIIPLISADFLATAAHMEQLQAAVVRQRRFDVALVPIEVRPVAELPELLHGISCFPTDGKAISLWGEPDQAWSLVVREIMGRIQPAGQIPTDPRELPGWSARAQLADLLTQLDKELREDERNVPGPSALRAAAKLMQTQVDYSAEADSALTRIINAENFSARQLAMDVFFLRMVAAVQPVIKLPQSGGRPARAADLPALLPGVFVDLLFQQIQLSAFDLDGLARVPANAGSKAAAEPLVLRLAAQVVNKLTAATEVDFRTRLTLTFQLAQWCFNALDHHPGSELPPILFGLRAVAPSPLPPQEAAKDLLYPFRFAANRFNYRLAAILYSLGPIEPSSSTNGNSEDDIPRLFAVSSVALEDLLVKLAALPLSEDDRELRRQPLVSCLGWDATEPSSIPALALWCLLGRDAKRFADLPEPARSAWLERLAPTLENALPADTRILPGLLTAGGVVASKLSAAERRLWSERALMWTASLSRPDLASGDKTELGKRIALSAWFALIHLFGAGETNLLQPLQYLFTERLKESIAADLLSYYFAAVAHRSARELRSEVMRLLALAKDCGVEAHQVVGSLARTINSGTPDAREFAQDTLYEVQHDKRYQSPQIRDLARRLGAD